MHVCINIVFHQLFHQLFHLTSLHESNCSQTCRTSRHRLSANDYYINTNTTCNTNNTNTNTNLEHVHVHVQVVHVLRPPPLHTTLYTTHCPSATRCPPPQLILILILAFIHVHVVLHCHHQRHRQHHLHQHHHATRDTRHLSEVSSLGCGMRCEL